MPSFHIDDDWNLIKDPPSNKDLSDIANAYQNKYFPGATPELEIEITDNPRFGGTAAYAPTENLAHLVDEPCLPSSSTSRPPARGMRPSMGIFWPCSSAHRSVP